MATIDSAIKVGVITLISLFVFFWGGMQVVDHAFNQANVNRFETFTPNREYWKKHFHAEIVVMSAHSINWDRDFGWGNEGMFLSRGHYDFDQSYAGNIATTVMKVSAKIPIIPEMGSSSPDVAPVVAAMNRYPPSTWFSPKERFLHVASFYQYYKETYKKNRIHLITDTGNFGDYLSHNRVNYRNYEAGWRHYNRFSDRFRHDYGGVQIASWVLAADGAHALEGNLDNLEVLFDAGLRMMSLTSTYDSEYGGSLYGSGAGLTKEGKLLLSMMEELGVLVDVAYASPALLRDIIGNATKPVVCSLCGIAGTHLDEVGLTDEEIKLIASNGGVIGVGFSQYYAGAELLSVAPVVDAIQYVSELVGVDHVGFGGGFDMATELPIGSSDMLQLTQSLLSDLSMSSEDMGKVAGGNFYRVLAQTLPEGDRKFEDKEKETWAKTVAPHPDDDEENDGL